MKKETVIILTKYILDIMYFTGIIITISLPWSVKWIIYALNYWHFQDVQVLDYNYSELVIIYFILGILANMILGELRKIFRTVLADNCFVMENVSSLQRIGAYSFVIAGICFLRTVLYVTAAMFVLTFVFIIAGLFSKVLAFVFDKAVEYKLENDLTI